MNMAFYDINGNEVSTSNSKQTNDVLIASSGTDDAIKENADYVCTGVNDELVIQQAIEYIASKGGGKIRFSNGKFSIDSFPLSDTDGSYSALKLPIDVSSTNVPAYKIEFIGAGLPYGAYKANAYMEGTKLEVSESCFESLSSSTQYKIISSSYVGYLSQASVKVTMALTDMVVVIPSNQKKVMAIDCLYMNGAEIKRVQLRSFKPGYDDFSSSNVKIAVDGSVGLRMMSGSNAGMAQNFYQIGAFGFYEGFQCGSEHVVGINLYALQCVYGYTFGKYNWMGNFNHDITLINCCDEKNVNLPLFADNGRKSSYSGASTGGPQAISLIDFNMERYTDGSGHPQSTVGDFAKETTQGKFRGTIEYTLMKDLSTNAVDVRFWEHGHGHGFVTRNRAQLLSGSSTVRRSYAPNYLQQFYDTTVGKMLWCVDTATPTWKDGDGNTVA